MEFPWKVSCRERKANWSQLATVVCWRNRIARMRDRLTRAGCRMSQRPLYRWHDEVFNINERVGDDEHRVRHEEMRYGIIARLSSINATRPFCSHLSAD
jgi:hypothetical protein